MALPRVVPGQLVTSRAGRDEGQAYLVLRVLDESFVLVADGAKRPLAKPKRKNIRHLNVYPMVAVQLRKGFESTGKQPRDEEIRHTLATMCEQLWGEQMERESEREDRS
ncbi:MAG TPA: RNA-binding protein [Firmicutes bacterium]|nr:RNA-binding protein [Bacillota bacterium]